MVSALALPDRADRAVAKIDAHLQQLASDAAARWQLLADLRGQGRKPQLPIFITMRNALARNVESVGCFAIVHRPGFPIPVQLLDGLDVRLDFGPCELAGKVKRLMDARGVTPRSLRAWCDCAAGLVVTCGACDDGSEPWAS